MKSKSFKMVKIFLAYILFLCVSLNYLIGQDRKELEQQRNQLQKEINEANELLKSVGLQKDRSVESIVLLRKRITLRQSNITTLKSELNILEREIAILNSSITNNEATINRIKINYANDILLAYKLKSSKIQLMYIFGSYNLDQAFQRFKYLSIISKSRREKVQQIQEVQNDLNKQLTNVVVLRNEKRELIKSLDNELVVLNRDLKLLDEQIGKLKQEEERIKRKIRESQKLAEELNRKIKQIIENEIAKNKKGKLSFDLTPEEIVVSDSFEKNKSKLPWPIERGFITERFGTHEHPVFKGVVTRNDGVDIATENNSSVRTVFEGIVTNVLIIPGLNKVVLVRHGRYLTVYSNLEEVYVQRGQKVKTKEIIGKVNSDGNRDFSIVKFQIWKENEKLNPEDWLTIKR